MAKLYHPEWNYWYISRSSFVALIPVLFNQNYPYSYDEHPKYHVSAKSKQLFEDLAVSQVAQGLKTICMSGSILPIYSMSDEYVLRKPLYSLNQLFDALQKPIVGTIGTATLTPEQLAAFQQCVTACESLTDERINRVFDPRVNQWMYPVRATSTCYLDAAWISDQLSLSDIGSYYVQITDGQLLDPDETTAATDLLTLNEIAKWIGMPVEATSQLLSRTDLTSADFVFSYPETADDLGLTRLTPQFHQERIQQALLNVLQSMTKRLSALRY